MNRTRAWALLGAMLVVMLVVLAAFRVYYPAGLLWSLIVMWVVMIMVLLLIYRASKIKQAG